MVQQVYSEYHLPMMPDTLTVEEVRYWYEPLIPQIIDLQKAAKKRKQ